MRAVRIGAGLLLAASAALLGAAGTASADASPSPSASDGDGAGPTEAGTSFRTAQLFQAGQEATADASSGDYLYWRVPVDAGQRPAVTAEVSFPDSSARRGATTWQVDVYDGLRRRQPCMYGTQTRTLAPDQDSVELRCTLRTVRAWAQPWSNDPLPGDYYIRVTAVGAGQSDLGLPMAAKVSVDAPSQGGAFAVGGKLAAPLVPGAKASDDGSGAEADDSTASADDGSGDGSDASSAPTAATVVQADDEPDGGWSSGWWTDRWLWTGGGAVGAALAGVGGYHVTRPRRRAVPPPQY
ncbi:hypothetical protein [Streptomyces fuscigenes]|uniref:hypothetical protein n=1 Tax=Streptomyces fuscigenes TaxID=1528880 RepID=UPI001F334038|nr:hypothetical protein [Streptomyces fuscigenes]MCF3964117.1 hypothetical protein [Streptomyces fuscigenes]